MSIDKIRQALITPFSDNVFGLPCVYDNTDDYSPQTDTPYCEALFKPAEKTPITLGDSGEDEVTGILSIALNYPLNSGIGETMDKVDQITGYFKPGVQLTAGGQSVTVTNVDLAQPGATDGFYQSVVTINWRSTIPR